MMRPFLPLFLFAVLLCCGPSIANANCREDPRTVEIDSENIVRLKSYGCTVGESAADSIKVEFHRISDPAAGLIIEKRSSKMLTKAIGSPAVVENEVFTTYADLLKRYGEATDRQAYLRLESAGKLGSIGSENVGPPDAATGGAFKVLLPTFPAVVAGGPPFLHADFYPAVDEIAALRKKTIPSGMKFFYKNQCEQEVCTTMVFWRGMQANDVKNYSKNLKDFNRVVGHFSDVGTVEIGPVEIPKSLRLLSFIAGGDLWPEDFAIMMGASNEILGCGEGGGWEFWYLRRTILLDVVTIENVSKRSIVIDGLLGSDSIETKLRPSSTFTATRKTALGQLSRSMAPGQKILVPLRISLVPSDDFKKFFEDENQAVKIYKRRGSSGFSGKAPHEVPIFKNYEFGRSLRVSGVYLNGNQVDFDQRSANFVDIALAYSENSCPYLLSWNGSEQQWINHGKVLDKAKTRQKQYMEMTTFPDLRQRFRLQEREPEIAYIDQAELAITLKNGNSLELKSTNIALSKRDGEYIKLYWGDSIEFEFALPENIKAKGVTQSRLMVTGYYEPYSNRLAQDGAPMTPTSGTRMNYCPAN